MRTVGWQLFNQCIYPILVIRLCVFENQIIDIPFNNYFITQIFIYFLLKHWKIEKIHRIIIVHNAKSKTVLSTCKYVSKYLYKTLVQTCKKNILKAFLKSLENSMYFTNVLPFYIRVENVFLGWIIPKFVDINFIIIAPIVYIVTFTFKFLGMLISCCVFKTFLNLLYFITVLRICLYPFTINNSPR